MNDNLSLGEGTPERDRGAKSRWKRLSLYGITVSVGLSALLGISALLSGDFGDLQVQILLTTLTTSGASICALACLTLWEGKHQKYPALPGLGLAIVGAILVCGGIWTESRLEVYWKFAITLTLFAVASAHMSLLASANLQRNHRWSVSAAYLFTYGLASTIAFMVWVENGGDAIYRFIGVQSIVVVSLSVAVPIFHRLGAAVVATGDESAGQMVKMLCPHCEAEQRQQLGLVVCHNCHGNFMIRKA